MCSALYCKFGEGGGDVISNFFSLLTVVCDLFVCVYVCYLESHCVSLPAHGQSVQSWFVIAFKIEEVQSAL